MITSNDIMSDAEVAKLVHLSLDRFQRRMRTGFEPGEFDFRQADPGKMGRRRVWLRVDVERIINEKVVAK